MKKLVAAALTANIEKIAVVGPPFSGKTRFLQICGSLGDPKIVKTGRAFRQKTVENNGPFKNVFFFDLGVASALILEYLGAILSYFSTSPSSSPLSPPFLAKPLQTLHLQHNPTPRGTQNRAKGKGTCMAASLQKLKKPSKRGRDINGCLPPKINKTKQKGGGQKWLPPSKNQQNRAKGGGT